MDTAKTVFAWLLSHLRAPDVWNMFSALLANPLGLLVAEVFAGIVVAGVLVALPFVYPRRIAYRLGRSAYFAWKLAKVCYSRARWFLKRGWRGWALKHLDRAIYVLWVNEVWKYSDETGQLYRACLDSRALAHEQASEWHEAVKDLNWLTGNRSTATDPSQAGWLRRLANAEEHLHLIKQAHKLRRNAENFDKMFPEISATTSATTGPQLWPAFKRLVMNPVRLSAKLQAALADVAGLRAANGNDADAMYAQALRELEEAITAEPASPEAYRGLILARVRLHQWQQTIADCDRAIAAGIEDPTILAARGEAALNLGLFEDALTDSAHAIELSATSLYAYRVRGVAHLKLQRWAEAIIDLTAALKLDDKDSVSYAYRAEARRWEGQITAAAEDADNAVSHAAELPFARLVRVLVTLRRWDIDRQPDLLDAAERDCAWIVAAEPAGPTGYWAQALVLRARGKPDEALGLATQAIKRDPRFAPAYQMRGWLYLSQSAWSEAAAEFVLAIARGTPADRAESHFGLAECQRMQKKVQPAIESYGAAIKLAPNYAWAYYGRGEAHAANGNRTQAIADYTQAITRGLRLSELYRARAGAYFDHGLDAEAMRDYAEAAELQPKSTDILLEWGATLVFAGSAGEGIEKFSEALKLKPESDEGYARRGWARGVAGDLKGAVDDETQAIGLNAKAATHFNNRAWAQCKLKHWSAAIADCGAAIKLDKSLDYAFKNRSLARWALGRRAAALKDLTEMVRLRQDKKQAPATERSDRFNWQDQARDWTKALAGREDDAIGLLGCGLAYWMADQPGAAEQNIRRAVELSPELALGRDVLAAIAQRRAESATGQAPA